MNKPFDAAITRFYEEQAPDEIRRAIKGAGKKRILTPPYPYDKVMDGDDYKEQMAALQIELMKCQSWVEEAGARVVVVFEGRDAAGKGGTIARLRENLNPRVASTVALSKPSDVEAGQWYFQRYVAHLPSAGRIALFDRSWYNRAVVEPVFGFCSPEETAAFYDHLPQFETMLTEDGIILVKLWLNVGRAEQLRRFLQRERDPLKQWKLSPVDVKGLALWDEYTTAIATMFERSHTETAPWTVVRSDDKKRARLGGIRAVLARVPYEGRDPIAMRIDEKIVGGPEIWLEGA